ncbi:hypothetical protein A2841_02550 [Candidatus Kaiserbacteria bacterium RIFCSPHIGHO2_01_FULL_48_10]|uniref:TrbC/VirB2 family protein n=1 Tax=Candidatus Kaiserbacteria bacterium RIFCSPHIGHO2_01_FULL_48_10 TaxID=1798476 RepID=A0A1F6C2R3_9BACT|nr:MAG: hypothetical protein A2841_02550 [Candidatus Kaiserbacteria bacterium RIFCSPHIGHO2_01_FULL_48_10]
MTRKIIPHAVSLLILFAPSVAFAKLTNPLGYDSLTEFLERILQLVVYIMVPIITLFIVYTGFLFVSSSGDPKKLQKAKEYFFWAVIGALIVLGAQALSMAIQATVDDLQRGL